MSESDASGWQFAGDEIPVSRPPAHRPLASGELTSAWQLDEFFEALGPVMRLPPKDRSPDESASVAGRTTHRSPRLVGIALATMLGALAWRFADRLSSRSQPLPAEFVGAWRTTSVHHAERMLEITGDTLRLGVGGDSILSYPIVKVRGKNSVNVRSYTITYRDGAGTLDLALEMDPDTTLRIVHLPTVSWRKAGP